MSRRFRDIAISVLASLVIVGGFGLLTKGFQKWNPKDWIQKEDKDKDSSSSGMVTDIEESGLKIKKLSTETLNGNFVHTYSYTISPSNASNQNVTAVASYVNGATYDNVVQTEVNNTAKTITLKTSATTGFDKQVKVVVTSVANPSATATMLVDFKKRLNSVSVKQIDKRDLNFVYGVKRTNTDNGLLHNFSLENSVNFHFSKYTIDTTETYTYRIISLTIDSFYDSDGHYLFEEDTSAYDEIVGALEGHADSQELETLTAQQVWNLCSNNDYHSELKFRSNDTENYYSFKLFEFEIEIFDKENKAVYGLTDGDFEGKGITNIIFSLYPGYDYSASSYVVGVDSVLTESTQVVF